MARIAPTRGRKNAKRKTGGRLTREPAARPSLLAVLATLAPLDEDIPPDQDKLPEPVDI